jgi:hypothetical protein
LPTVNHGQLVAVRAQAVSEGTKVGTGALGRVE